jgi:hypothetical protein
MSDADVISKGSSIQLRSEAPNCAAPSGQMSNSNIMYGNQKLWVELVPVHSRVQAAQTLLVLESSLSSIIREGGIAEELGPNKNAPTEITQLNNNADK